MKRLIICLILVTCLLSGISIKAEEKSSTPTKESLVTAWEEALKKKDTTVILEKTAEPGNYTFETTLFPYKGKLKILNVLISKNIDYYHNYDIQDDSLTTGALEVELSDAPESFFKKYPISTEIWKNQNYLFYIRNANQWMTEDQWQDYQKKNTDNSAQKISCNKTTSNYKNLLFDFLPAILIILFISLLILRTRKVQKAQIKKYDLSMQRQMDSLKILEEQRQILKDILNQLQSHETL